MNLNSPVLLNAEGLARGENARVEVHPDLNGGCKLVIIDAKHPGGFPVGLSPQTTIGLALAMLQTVGVPIQAELAKKLRDPARS